MSASISGRMITLEGLNQIPCPAPSGIWKPIPHRTIVDTVLDTLAEQGIGYSPDSLKMATNRERTVVLGAVDVALPSVTPSPEQTFSVGFRSSINKSVAVKIMLGTRVFICDNGMMVGDSVASLHKRHTINLDLREEFIDTIAAFHSIAQAANRRTEELQNHNIAFDQGCEMLFKAVGADALPKSRLLHAYEQWDFNYHQSEKALIEHPGTAWALQQSITAEWKHQIMLALEWRSNNLSNFMGEIVPVRLVA